MAIKIICVDDHKLFLQGLVNILNSDNDIEVVGQFNESKQFFRKLYTRKVDLITLDINMPDNDGIEICKQIKKFNQNIKVLFITMHENNKIFKMICDAGADGYVSKNIEADELLDVIKKIYDGNTHFSILHNGSKNTSNTQPIIHNLTNRELQIAHEIIAGKTTKIIAKNFYLSEYTVDTHKKNIFKKLNIHSAIELIKYIK